jgi:hypothetical protein
MRWTQAALLTRVLTLRTAKSCGPDAPTLASNWLKKFQSMTVATKPGHRGEREATVKTIARGMPGVSGVTVVTNACAFYTSRTRLL